ncbi:SNF2-related protein, partial [Corchorus capsularis]
ERVIKVILFVLSLQSTARRPSLIISKSTALSIWESEFIRVASSANIIFYNGSKDVRSSIRSLEFYDESGSIMFEILLSSYNIVAEDLDILKGIEWGAIIVDECQSSHMSRYFGQIKKLIADMRLLLVSGQIKECDADYQNMLSLLDSGYELGSDNLKKIDSYTNDYKLKDIFSQYIAFECKLRSSSFVEYWVPVQLSHLQLEQYCATLLSNSMFLASSSKSDPVDVLRDVIISTRKCCDHPYLLDESLQSVVTKGLSAEEKLDVEIKASGKLELLDNILKGTKARDLRVLILFQSIGGSGRDSVGNILDDLICQRFGKQSYVRIDGGQYARSKKKDFVNTFNNKESGISFLLLEDRACHPSIKLSAVDVVILFDSGLEPQNDIKALHRISIGSQFEEIKIFRLYSSFTVEEKILILAKEGTSVDSNIWTLNRNSCLRLLSWGASYLFNKLDEFHGCSKSVSVSDVSCEKSILNAVFLELLTQLPCSGESNHSAMRSFITKVPQNAVYDGNTSLFGEKEIGSMNNELSIFSWQKLLEGRDPQWKWLSDLSPRNRKKVNYLDNPPRKSEFGDGGVIMKSQIGVNSADDRCPKWKFKGKRKPTVPNPKWKVKGNKKATVPNKKRKLAAPSRVISEKDLPCSTDGRKDVNQNNPLLLKLGISKLCEILLLPENVKSIAVSFLEYIIQEYKVSCKSTSTSQAYQLSLCWTAADLLKHKVDKNESLALAKLGLNLDCREEEVKDIYSELQSVAKEFAQCSENLEGDKKSNCSKKVCGDPRYTVQKNIPSSPNCSQSGTVHGASSKDPDRSLVKKTVSSSSTRMVAGHFGSDTEHGGTGTEAIVSEEVRATCDNQQHKVSSSVAQPKYHALTSDSQELQSPLQSGTVHGASSKDPDESLMEKTVSSSSTRKVAGHFGSDSEHGGTGTEAIGSEEVRATCNSEHGGTITEAIGSEEVRATCNLEHGGTGTEAIGSEEVRATCNSEHGGTGTEAIGSEEVRATCNSEHGITGTEAIVSEEVRATCDNQQHKVSSSVVQPKHHALTSDSQELQSPLQSGTVHGASSKDPDESLMEKTASSSPTRTVVGHFGSDSEHGGTGTEVIVSEEVRATCDNQQHEVSSSSVQPKHHALTSDSQELQSPLQPPATESATELSEVPQAQCTAVFAGNDLMISTDATQPNEENDETDAVTSERETVSEMGHHDAAVTRLSGDSNALEFPGTGQFLLEADINTVESNPLLCQETAVSSLLPARPSSAESNISAIPASGVQHDLSSNWHVLCQEAPVPRQESLEVLLDEQSNAPVRNSVTLLPQQPSSSTPMAESETCTDNQRTTSTPSRPPNDLPCQVDTFRPVSVTPQPAVSNPLRIELARLKNFWEKTSKQHEDTISRLKSERDKEVEEICKKYDMLVQDAEMTFTKRRQDYESYCNTVHSNNLLAEILTFNFDNKAVQFAGIVFDSVINHLAQQPTVMLDPRIETSLGAPPPLHMFNHSPSAVVAPQFAPTVCVAESNQVCNVRAPAPHLRALNSPSMSIPPTSALHGRMRNQQIANNPPAISPNLHVSALLGRTPNQQLANNLPAISPDLHLSALQGSMPNQQQLANNLPAISPDPYLSALQGRMPNQQQLANNLPAISPDPHLSVLQGRMPNQQLAHTQLRISPTLPQGTSRLPTETLGLHPVVAGTPVYDRYIPALELLANIGNHVSPDLQHQLRPHHHQNFGLPSYMPNLTDQIATDSLIVPTAAINAETICLSDDD